MLWVGLAIGASFALSIGHVIESAGLRKHFPPPVLISIGIFFTYLGGAVGKILAG